jgi:hypothetical protein
MYSPRFKHFINVVNETGKSGLAIDTSLKEIPNPEKYIPPELIKET